MKDKRVLVLLLILLVAFGSGVVVGFLYGKHRYVKMDTVEIVDDNGSNNDNNDADTSVPVLNEKACKKDFCDYSNEAWGISFTYPKGWYIEENDFGDLIVVTDGFYRWDLWVDPVFTGGGTGFNIDISDSLDVEIESENRAVSPDSYDGYMVTSYVKGSSIPDEIAEGLGKNDDKWYWNFSQYTVSLDDTMGIGGFGEGEMYDDISYNFFQIGYTYKVSEYHPDSDTYTSYLPPERGTDELNDALLLMDGITNSLEVK